MLWTWDIETVEWDRPRCVVAVSEAGDVERFTGPGCLEQISRVMDDAGGQWIAHAAGIFDTLLLTNARPKPWRELVLSGSAVLVARDGKTRVRDSFRWWLAGLAKVGRYLEQLDDEREARGEPRRGAKGQWLKQDVDRTRIGKLTEAEVLDYCESDTRILLEGVQAARSYFAERGADPAWTAGASALSLLRTLEPGTWHLLKRKALPLDTAISAGSCVRGARVESWAQGMVEGVYCYDFKSAYPAAYAAREIGIGARRISPGERASGAVWRVRWRWPWRDRIPPVLDQLSGAGAGDCEAWCVEDEIEDLEAEGVKVTRIEGWAPALMFPVGQAFARDLFDEKERGSFFAKVFLNSLHGKFSESPIKESWTSYYPKQWWGENPELIGDYWRYNTLSVDKRGKVPPHLQPLAAAHILGRTRSKLWREGIRPVIRAGGEVYYCDTDSVHCNLSPERMPVELGTGLGQLAYEGGPYTGFYVGPKAYCLCDPSSGAAVKGALKGMPWAGLKDGVRAGRRLYRAARDIEAGQDLRREVFERALALPEGVEILREGITSWTFGAKGGAGWGRFEQPRTLRRLERGKTFKAGGSPTAWAYRTPAETLAGRTPVDAENADD